MSYKNELYHHGVKGQKWGVRRYQNPDGTLTAAGRSRYLELRSSLENATTKKEAQKASREYARFTNRITANPTGARNYINAVSPHAKAVSEAVRAAANSGDPIPMDAQSDFWRSAAAFIRASSDFGVSLAGSDASREEAQRFAEIYRDNAAMAIQGMLNRHGLGT